MNNPFAQQNNLINKNFVNENDVKNQNQINNHNNIPSSISNSNTLNNNHFNNPFNNSNNTSINYQTSNNNFTAQNHYNPFNIRNNNTNLGNTTNNNFNNNISSNNSIPFILGGNQKNTTSTNTNNLNMNSTINSNQFLNGNSNRGISNSNSNPEIDTKDLTLAEYRLGLKFKEMVAGTSNSVSSTLNTIQSDKDYCIFSVEELRYFNLIKRKNPCSIPVSSLMSYKNTIINSKLSSFTDEGLININKGTGSKSDILLHNNVIKLKLEKGEDNSLDFLEKNHDQLLGLPDKSNIIINNI